MASKASFTIQFNAFRLYEDGSESGSTPLEDQDNNHTTPDISGGDYQFHLRARLDEVGGVSGATTDDYGLEYNYSGGGGWTAVTASSSIVQVDSGGSLSDGSATTNRSTNGISDPGAGSFVAGEQEQGNGTVEDLQVTANNFTECVWACKIISADVANGTNIDFRITLNGGTPGMTNNVTPNIAITKTASDTTVAQARSTFRRVFGRVFGRVN